MANSVCKTVYLQKFVRPCQHPFVSLSQRFVDRSRCVGGEIPRTPPPAVPHQAFAAVRKGAVSLEARQRVASNEPSVAAIADIDQWPHFETEPLA
jgi:hypothetical protein